MKVILEFKQSLDQELVVLHRKLFMLGKISGYAWSLCGGLKGKHSRTVHWQPNSFEHHLA
jgi:hypothetical protein